MAKRNILTRSKKLKAEESLRANRLEEAKALYASVCQVDRSDADAWAKLGVINRKLKDFTEAENCSRRALALQPKLPSAHLALGGVLQCQGRIEEALLAYRAAIHLDPGMAEAHYFLANVLKDIGALNDAVMHFKKAVAIKPDFLEALSNLGAALTLLNKLEEAIAYLNRAQKIQPDVPQVLCNMGNILVLDGRFDDALNKYQRALSYAPDSLDALEKLAHLYEKMGRLEDAKPLVARGLILDQNNAALNIVAAKIARSEGRIQDAIALLEKIDMRGASFEIAVDIHLNLGKLYDRMGDAARAFQNINDGNRLRALHILRDQAPGQDYWRKLEQIASFLTDSLGQQLAHAQASADTTPSPIFLMGFPRSGTTLLDQILDSHPRLMGMEEKPTVEAMTKTFLNIAEDRPDALASLRQDEVDQLRKVYFETVAQYVTLKPGVILVDRMPLNTINAHLIWRVFPDAKFILAVRHPCDVCLSCFMQNFVQNEAMSNFLTLENTARLYARVMGLWQEYVRLLPINFHRVRYEDLVVDFEAETRKLLDFLGVAWDDAVRGHTEHARKRVINTASYHQVTQPIYQHAKYRWKRYAKQMEPVMEILKPYIDYFGYTWE